MVCQVSSQRRAFFVMAISMFATFLQGPVSSVAFEEPPKEQAKTAAKQNVIRIGKDTTRITKPLDKEGYVDYLQAANDRQSAGVTPQNNFEVVVRRVMPPAEISEPFRKEYFARIGIPEPDKNARFYQDFISFSSGGEKDQKLEDSLLKEYDFILSHPWTAAEHPRAAKWVAAYGPDLDKLVEGSKRAKYYTPYLAGGGEEEEAYPKMISVLLPSVQQQREIARGLFIRVMGRIGAGDLDGAWSDLQAMHRVARHVGQGFSLIESLVGIAIDAMAFQAEIQILNSPKLTLPQIKRFRADLQALKPLPPMADKIDQGERFMGLDAVTALARHSDKQGLLKMLEMINALSDATEGTPLMFFVAAQNEKPAKAGNPVGPIDWNVTMVMMNVWYDKIVAAAREPNFEKRHEKFAEINRDLKKLAADAKDTRNILGLIAKGGPRKAMGESIGRILVALLLPAIDAARSAEDQATARRELMPLAFSVEQYHREKGALPKSLSDLVPQYIPTIANDPLSGKSLIYETKNGGFLLYSVGRNGTDDKGRSYDDAERQNGIKPGWDDIVIRVGS